MKFPFVFRKFGQHLAEAKGLVYLGCPGERLLIIVQHPFEDPYGILPYGLALLFLRDIVLDEKTVTYEPPSIVIKLLFLNTRLCLVNLSFYVSVTSYLRYTYVSPVSDIVWFRVLYI